MGANDGDKPLNLQDGEPVAVADSDRECILCHILDMVEPDRPTVIVQMNQPGEPPVMRLTIVPPLSD